MQVTILSFGSHFVSHQVVVNGSDCFKFELSNLYNFFLTNLLALFWLVLCAIS